MLVDDGLFSRRHLSILKVAEEMLQVAGLKTALDSPVEPRQVRLIGLESVVFATCLAVGDRESDVLHAVAWRPKHCDEVAQEVAPRLAVVEAPIVQVMV